MISFCLGIFYPDLSFIKSRHLVFFYRGQFFDLRDCHGPSNLEVITDSSLTYLFTCQSFCNDSRMRHDCHIVLTPMFYFTLSPVQKRNSSNIGWDFSLVSSDTRESYDPWVGTDPNDLFRNFLYWRPDSDLVSFLNRPFSLLRRSVSIDRPVSGLGTNSRTFVDGSYPRFDDPHFRLSN